LSDKRKANQLTRMFEFAHTV